MDATLYLWLKAFHIIAVISWMAGMLYLPRLYVYHCEVKVGSPEDERFQLMERRLLRLIINPAMILTFIIGGYLAWKVGGIYLSGWFHAKMLFIILLAATHGMFARWRKAFVRGENKKSARFFRIANEVPTVLMVVIVILAVVKPF